MKAKTKFLKMYHKLPEEAKLIPWILHNDLYTPNVIAFEIKNDTKLGQVFLDKLGYTSDSNKEDKDGSRL